MDITAEIYGTADHADAGAVTEDVVRIARLDAADHSDPAGLEFGKRVADIAKIPRLKRFEARVPLGHCVATGATTALDVEDALGAGVMGAVGDVAQDRYLGPAVYPADIVRGAAVDDDLGPVKAHRAAALPDRAFDIDAHVFSERPEPPAETVLAGCFDEQVAGAVFDGRLDIFLHIPRGDSVAVDLALDSRYFLV